jgi:hypothetical protein
VRIAGAEATVSAGTAQARQASSSSGCVILPSLVSRAWPNVRADEKLVDQIRFAHVAEVTVERDAGGQIECILVPLIPLDSLPDTVHFAATVLNDLAKLGVPWPYICQQWEFAPVRTDRPDCIAAVIEQEGRLVQDGWVDGKGWTTYRCVPSESMKGDTGP